MTERIDIHNPLAEICGRLGLEPELVGKLVITPVKVTATVYKRNEDGKKYIDAATLMAAAVEEEFKVKT